MKKFSFRGKEKKTRIDILSYHADISSHRQLWISLNLLLRFELRGNANSYLIFIDKGINSPYLAIKLN